MKTILNPNIAEASARPSRASLVLLAGLILVLLMFGFYVLTKTSEQRGVPTTPPLNPSPIPSVDYQALVNAETSKARVQSQQIMARHKDSLVGLDSKYAMRFSLAAYEASASAAEYQSILKLIGKLAWDKVKGTNEGERHLKSKIEPSISRVMSEFNLKLISETAKFDNDLQKVAVQQAANLAAIGPGNPHPPARVVSQQATAPEFQTLLKNLGWAATGFGTFRVADIANGLNPNMLRSIAKPVHATALRMFAKQIARGAGLPLVASATGPIPIGAILAALGALYSVYDIYQLQADFERDVNIEVRAKLNQIRYVSMDNAEQYASSRAKEIEKIQSMIATKALNNLTNIQSK